MRDCMHKFGAFGAILPAVLSDDPAPITIDRAGYEALAFVLYFGAGGIAFTNNNRIDFIIEHSDDGALWAAVDPTNVLGAVADANGVVLSQRSAHAAPTVHRFGYVDGVVGEKRYVRLRVDFNGAHANGTPMAALAILDGARSLPVAA